jgi:hypothetical protein
LSGTPLASKRKVVWEFDPKGRRTRQTAYDGSSGSYGVIEDLKFVNDGWHCIAELNATNNALVRSYAWWKRIGVASNHLTFHPDNRLTIQVIPLA